MLRQYFADSYGPLNVLLPFTSVAGVLIFCWIPALKNVAGTVVWSLLFGAAQGAFVAMLPAWVHSRAYCTTCAHRAMPGAAVASCPLRRPFDGAR